MEIMRETDPRFINIEKKIGVFVLIAIMGVIMVVIFTGMQQDVFTSKTKIYFIAKSGQDINKGQSVKLSGFKIGKVKKSSLDDIARVRVELSINTKYMKWIKRDSKAKLLKEGLIGDTIIEIIPGSINAKELTENDIIAFEKEKSIGEIAEELKDEIKPVLTDVRQIIHYINDPEGDIKQTLKNVKNLSKDLITTQKHLDTLLQNTDKNITATITKIDPLINSANQTITTTNNLIKKLDKEMPNMLEKVNRSLENVEKTTEEIKKATEHAPPLVEKGSDIVDSTKEVVDSIKQMWPIRSFIEQPEEKTLKVDSYE